VNVTYDPRFRQDTNGIIRPLVRGGTGVNDSILTFIETTRIIDPLIHSQGAMGTLACVIDGMLNGAIMGMVYVSAISGIVGVTIRGLGGAITNAQ
jgi:hypothetical protein